MLFTPKQKIDLMRQAETHPGVAILNGLEILRSQMEAVVKTEIEKIDADLRKSKLPIDIVSKIKSVKGDKGDVGATPVIDYKGIINETVRIALSKIPKAKDGYTPDEETLLTLIKPLIPKVANGETPTKEYLLSLIHPLIPSPIDLTTNEERIKELVLSLIPEYDDSELEAKIESLRNEIEIVKSVPRGKRYMHGGGDTVKQGTNITITTNSDGSKTISGGASSGLNVLAATGAVDNSNVTFTFASAPTLVVVNGVTFRNGHGVTITGTTAVLDSYVGTGGDIYGLG